MGDGVVFTPLEDSWITTEVEEGIGVEADADVDVVVAGWPIGTIPSFPGS
jgi:hypothetical protein